MSSLKDLASLIMIPSLVKDGRLDTVKPLGNSIIHPDATGNNDGTDGSTPAEGNFTFSRGSNLSATRVNASQLIEKGRENLLLQSNQLDTTWSSQNLTATGNQTGYDSSNDAWKLTPSTADTYHRIINGSSSVSASVVVTLSVYAKADGYNFIRVSENANSGDYATFNLSTGVVENSTSLNAKIESIGNGWYRCSSTITPVAIHRFDIYVMESANVQQPWAGDGTSGILVQDAQLELGLVATSVIETGASTAQAGILENTPRLDYSGGASCPSLLLEPQRANILTQSEYFQSNVFAIDRTTATPNAGTSPQGVDNAYLIQEDSANLYKRILVNGIAISASTTYTYSLFVKPYGATRHIYWMTQSGGDAVYAHFNMTNFSVNEVANNGSATGASASIEPYEDGWYRISLTGNLGSAAFVYNQFYIEDVVGTGFNPLSYQGDGNSGFYMYGWQIEAGSYKTSYIPTYGVSQTRAFDDCRKTGISSLIGQTEGTLFGELTFKSAEPTNRLFSITGTDWNSVGSIRFDIISLKPQATIRSLGGEPAKIIGTQDINVGSLVKFALVYTSTTLKMFVNGAQIGSTATLIGSLPSPINEITINALGGGFTNALQNNQLNPYKQALVFKTALTDSEAIALTTI